MSDISYQDLLKSPEWGNKRIEILKRDNYTCQRCGTEINNKIQTLDTHIGTQYDISFVPYPRATKDARKTILKLHSQHPGFPIKTNLSLAELNNNSNLKYIRHFIRKGKMNYPFVATLGKVNFDPQVHRSVANDWMIKLWKKHLSPDLEIDLEGIYVLDLNNYSEAEYFKNSILLEVHHKCYRKNVAIWEQPNNDYVTLCNICHRIVHENQLIPHLN